MNRAHRLTDSEIIEGLRGRAEEEAIRSIYYQYFEGLAHYVVHNSGRREDAEDIFQEVVIAFIRLVKEGKFRGESSIKTFLFALNRNLWMNELKRRGRAEQREIKYEVGKEEKDERIDQVIEQREGTKELDRTMDQLGEACKKILVLFYYQERSMKEILSELHYENEQVVRNKKYKCLKKLEEPVHSNPVLYKTLKNFLNG